MKSGEVILSPLSSKHISNWSLVSHFILSNIGERGQVITPGYDLKYSRGTV